MKLIKRIIFLSTFVGLFVIVYRSSDQKGFERFLQSFKITSFIVGIGSGFIPFSTKAFENNVPTRTNETLTERLLPSYNQELEFLEGNAQETLSVDLGKSGPGSRARSDARHAMKSKSKPGGGVFAETWLQNPSKRSRPAAANRLAQQLQHGQAEGFG